MLTFNNFDILIIDFGNQISHFVHIRQSFYSSSRLISLAIGEHFCKEKRSMSIVS